MIERSADTALPPCRGFDKHQLEGRIHDGEICIAGAPLRGLDPEEGGVEVDGLVEICDIQGKLQTRHPSSSSILTIIDVSMIDDVSTDVNMRTNA